VVDVLGEVVADGLGWDGDTRRPLLDEVFDVREPVVAGAFEILTELGGSDGMGTQGFEAHSPDGGDPGKTGACAPLVRDIEPEAVADGSFDGLAGFKGKQRRVADKNGGVCLLQHGDGVGGSRDKGRPVAGEFAKEYLGVGEGAARGSVGGD